MASDLVSLYRYLCKARECVCVGERERERERRGGTGREREREGREKGESGIPKFAIRLPNAIPRWTKLFSITFPYLCYHFC